MRAINFVFQVVSFASCLSCIIPVVVCPSWSCSYPQVYIPTYVNCKTFFCVEYFLFLDPEVEGGASNLAYWEELPCGVYSVEISASSVGKCLAGKVRKHEWTNSMLKDLIKWERSLIKPKLVDVNSSNTSLFSGNPDLHSGTLLLCFSYKKLKLAKGSKMKKKNNIVICFLG